MNLRWQLKLPLLLVAFATIPMVIMGAWTFALLEKVFEDAVLTSLEALSTAKAAAIDQVTDDRSTEVERIASLIADNVTRLQQAQRAGPPAEKPPIDLPELRDAEELPPPQPRNADEPRGAPPSAPTAEPAHEGSPARAEAPTTANARATAALSALRQELGLILWDQEKFEELLVIDSDGEVIASTFTAHEGTTASALDYFKHGLASTFVQPVFLSPLTERLTTVMATPIRDEQAQVIGVLAARLNLSSFFQLINDTTGLAETGETVVGQLEGTTVRFMAPTRHDPEAALVRTVDNDDERGAGLRRAARGEGGSGRFVDYRDHCVYAAFRHITALDWGLVVKIDCDEATAPVIDSQLRTLGAGGSIGLLALLLAILAARSLTRPLALLKAATERISRGELSVHLPIPRGDELGDLAESFERMVSAIRFFRDQERLDDIEKESDGPAPDPNASAEGEDDGASDEDPAR